MVRRAIAAFVGRQREGNQLIDAVAETGEALAATIHETVARGFAGTTLFDGEQARKGYALNKMCYSFNDAGNRAEFLRDEDAYCAKYRLNRAQRDAIAHRNVLELIGAGGNVYYLAKFAGMFGLDVQDLGAQQTGMSKDEFKAMLVAAAEG